MSLKDRFDRFINKKSNKAIFEKEAEVLYEKYKGKR